MTLYEAIVTVLTQAATPLHYHEITQRILQHGLWTAAGSTPHASVSAVLTTTLTQDGDAAVFLRTGPGTYALRPGAVGNELPGSPVSSAASSPIETPVEALSFNDAAALILEQYAHGQPLHYVAITEQALTLGLIQTKGQTPTATMNAQLTTEIGRAMQRGEVPRFVAHGKGWYGLSAWVPQGVAGEIAQHNANVRQQLRQRVQAMGGYAFEHLVGDLLHAVGFEDVVVTAKSGDGGVDVRGTLVECGGMIRTRYAVQAKCWQANIHAPEIQGLRGSLAADEHGLFVTTSEYSAGAYAEATALVKKPI
ncbi:MAG TPA: HTH domain-containing protein, partial [Armatimonadota bacterium]